MATLRFDRALSQTEQVTVTVQSRQAGARSVALTSNQHFHCTYAAFEASQEATDRIRMLFPSAALWDFLVIALAIEPGVRHALPFLQEAFGGAGKPDGVLRCECRAGSVVLEFAENRTSLPLVLALAEVELRRFGSVGRRIHLLSPVPIELQAKLAAKGLDLPRLDGSQILEVLIEQSHA